MISSFSIKEAWCLNYNRGPLSLALLLINIIRSGTNMFYLMKSSVPCGFISIFAFLHVSLH